MSGRLLGEHRRRLRFAACALLAISLSGCAMFYEHRSSSQSTTPLVQFLYGDGKVPLPLRSKLATATSKLASAIRGDQGTLAAPSREPDSLVELWSYEASPHCKLVRETLTELEVPYLLHNVARGSAKRDAFVARAGKMQVPYLVDATRDVHLFESRAIVAWLKETYATRTEKEGA